MDICKTVNGNTATVTLKGRLDTVTSAQLTDELSTLWDLLPDSLLFDFTELDYISSAGLRVILMAQKKVNQSGKKMEITGVRDTVREVFEITGFSEIIKINC